MHKTLFTTEEINGTDFKEFEWKFQTKDLKIPLQAIKKDVNKHLMTGPKGNSEFCFPEILNVESRTLGVEGKQNSLFPVGTVFYYTAQVKNRTNFHKFYTNFTQICHRFKAHDLIMSESKVKDVVSLGS